MTRDDVLRIADQSGWSVPSEWDTKDGFLMRLAHFVSLVEAHEREECAKVCEETTFAWTEHAYYSGCMDCARAIRARGES